MALKVNMKCSGSNNHYEVFFLTFCMCICQELPTSSLSDELQPKNLIFFATLCEWIASETNQTLCLYGRDNQIQNHDLMHTVKTLPPNRFPLT